MFRALLVLLILVPVSGGIGWFVARATVPMVIPVLVPVAAGAMVGIVLGFLAYLLAVRSRVALVLVALPAWLASALAMHWVEYRDGFIPAVAAEHAMEGNIAGDPGFDASDADGLADEMLTTVVGEPGFKGFLKLRARGGAHLRVAPAERSGTGGALVLWSVDLLAALAIILRIGWGAQTRLRLSSEPASRYNAGPPMGAMDANSNERRSEADDGA